MLLLTLSIASATVPMPVFPDCGQGGDCPSDLDNWDLLSTIPEAAQESVRPAELEMGAGIWLDQAVNTQTGRWEVAVAILDSGIEWGHSDLRYKVMLNTDELPLPQDADGVEAESHDLDGNGLVNIADYALDPRVSIDAGNDHSDDRLDPSDLIYTFQDGVDDDGNGYVDDIAGWDFFGDDNDAWHDYDTNFGEHGTGTAREAVGEGDNGGRIGTCPNCALIPLRTGDTFITDGNRAGQAIAYAVDNGAEVVGMAMGALDHPSNTTRALELASREGVVVVAAAGDENAYHHNLPSMTSEVLYVHSVHFDGIEENTAYSFHNFFNCNNYGPRTDLVAASDGCATGSTAKIAGLAGLIKSAGLDAGVDLDAEQVEQILIASSMDIHLNEEELELAGTYPSSEGWDPFYGYGRANARFALDLVEADEMPPTARLGGPEWFTVFYPDRHGEVAFELTAAAHDGSAVDWTLEWGQGWEPTDWSAVDSGNGNDLEGLTVNFDPSVAALVQVPEPTIDETLLERVERVHAPAVTLRLTVTDQAGRVGQARRTIYVHEDPDLKPGFPLALGGSGESSPVLADLDGDGIFEIVVASADGLVHAVTGSGEELQGWPVLTDTDYDVVDHADAPSLQDGSLDPLQGDAVVASAAAGDLDGDGLLEVVVATLEGRVFAWHADGSRVEGFPVQTLGREPEEFDRDHTYDEGILGAPTLVDLDGDGILEVLASGLDSRLYAWTASGQTFGDYPYEICHPENCGSKGSRIITSPTVGDVDGDGDLEIALGGNETVKGGNASVTHLIDALTGVTLPGWPVETTGLVAKAALLPIIGTGHPASVAMADLDGDGDLEIIDAVMLGQGPVLHHDGSVALEIGYAGDRYGELSNAFEPSFATMTNNPAVGDLDGDGTPDVFIGGAGTYALIGLALTASIDFHHALGGWSGATGEALIGFPRQVEDFQFLVAPTIADLDDDGAREVVYGSAGYLLHAWNSQGDSPQGWPKFTGQWLLGSPAIGDIDGDGYLDVMTTTREGFLYAWTTGGHADQGIEWASIHHDAQNTGNYEVPIPGQVGPLDVCADRGCCCRARSERKEGLALVLIPVLFGLLRRRR